MSNTMVFMRLSPFFVLCLVVYMCLVARGQEDDKHTTKTVFIDADSLPEPFTNDKLPLPQLKPETGKDTCYSLMGCYKEIPIRALHLNPLSIKTTFTIVNNGVESDIITEVSENCLRSKPGECDRYPFDLQQVKESPFKLDKRTIVIIGGFRSKAKGNWEVNMKELWSKMDDNNVIVVDWEKANDGIYYNAAANTRPVARQLTVLLYYLAKMKGGCDLDLNDDAYVDKFYILGHSLGAHIAGFVGSDLAGRLGRITGLDPAGPSFDNLDSQFRIDRSDARFVDILHTNAGSKVISFSSKFGSSLASGHIDLWANDGQHQPGCSTEMQGCSHKRSIKFYESFLSDILSMREYLRNKYRPMYRLRAYRSDNYDGFHEGSSLVERCPVSSMDDNDLNYSDLDRCSIPIDYLAWYSDYKRELQDVHGLDFSETVTTSQPNNFYFYTTADADHGLDHYLIKVRATKSYDGSSNAGEQPKVVPLITDGCSIGVDLEMGNGLGGNYKLEKYHLHDMKDHYEIVFPFLAANSIAKYEIAKLDSNDFFIKRQGEGAKDVIPAENLELLRRALGQVFPSSVILKGFQDKATQAAGRKKRGSFLESIKRFFKGEQSSEEENELSRGTNCKLPIESFIVQPLRKFRRHLSAFYSRDCSNDEDPKPEFKVILLGENEPSPKESLSKDAASQDNCNKQEFDESIKLQLTTLIIGPSLIVERDEDGGFLEVELYEEDAHNNPSTDVSKRTFEAKRWLAFTVILLIILIASIIAAIATISRTKVDKILNKQTMVRINTNQAALASRLEISSVVNN